MGRRDGVEECNWKEDIVPYIKVLSLNFPRYAEEHRETRVRITDFRTESVAWDFSNADRECKQYSDV
jgi:hypothetical protein